MLAKHLSADTHVGQMPFLPKVEGNSGAEEESDQKRSRGSKSKKPKKYACGHPGCGKVNFTLKIRRKLIFYRAFLTPPIERSTREHTMSIENVFTVLNLAAPSPTALKPTSISISKYTRANFLTNALIQTAQNNFQDCLRNMHMKEHMIIYCLMFAKSVERDLEKSLD